MLRCSLSSPDAIVPRAERILRFTAALALEKSLRICTVPDLQPRCLRVRQLRRVFVLGENPSQMVGIGPEIRSGASCALWQLRNQQPTSLEAAEIGVFGASSVGSLFPSAGSFNLSVSRMCCLPGGVWRGRQRIASSPAGSATTSCAGSCTPGPVLGRTADHQSRSERNSSLVNNKRHHDFY